MSTTGTKGCWWVSSHWVFLSFSQQTLDGRRRDRLAGWLASLLACLLAQLSSPLLSCSPSLCVHTEWVSLHTYIQLGTSRISCSYSRLQLLLVIVVTFWSFCLQSSQSLDDTGWTGMTSFTGGLKEKRGKASRWSALLEKPRPQRQQKARHKLRKGFVLNLYGTHTSSLVDPRLRWREIHSGSHLLSLSVRWHCIFNSLQRQSRKKTEWVLLLFYKSFGFSPADCKFVCLFCSVTFDIMVNT